MPPPSRAEALQRLRFTTKERRALEVERGRLVGHLRRYREPWRSIGRALGTSTQAAHRKYGRRVIGGDG